MMKPKAPNEHEDGMLEFLEDIIGSSRFKDPITQLAQRVEDLNELRGEKVTPDVAVVCQLPMETQERVVTIYVLNSTSGGGWSTC